MPPDVIKAWQHDHVFSQDKLRIGESRVLIVIAITAAAMVLEIVAGLMFGSMALLADGLHMGSHVLALTITAGAYIYARLNARNQRWAFGTGKVNALAGCISAVLLAQFALLMVWASFDRMMNPVEISFDEAIIVAVLGLVVNVANAKILHVTGHDHVGHHDHSSGHSDGHSEDHNLRAAYLHVLADALTSVLAICALLSGKYFGLGFMDPVMGIVGAVLVAHWSWGLLRGTGSVLLDEQASENARKSITSAIERGGDSRVFDLHVWSIGPGIFAAIISVVTERPRSPDEYKQSLPQDLGLVHVTVEVHDHAPE